MKNTIETLNQYQDAAGTFFTEGTLNSTLFLGLASETGEVLDEVLKVERVDKNYEENVEALILELGDVLWYVAMIAKRQGYSLQEVACKNFHKLTERELAKNDER
jgi:NTP pyrophosphatase (non-canonical NTP hydrolase)